MESSPRAGWLLVAIYFSAFSVASGLIEKKNKSPKRQKAERFPYLPADSQGLTQPRTLSLMPAPRLQPPRPRGQMVLQQINTSRCFIVCLSAKTLGCASDLVPACAGSLGTTSDSQEGQECQVALCPAGKEAGVGEHTAIPATGGEVGEWRCLLMFAVQKDICR